MTTAFFQQTRLEENSPQFYIWVEPREDDLVPPINIECWGKQSTVYTPRGGLLLNNHCVIDTGMEQASILLSDATYILINKGTIAQFNFYSDKTEIILRQGEIYNIVAEQPKDKKFIIKVGDTSLEAVGTEFGVRLIDDAMDVLVNDGSIASLICSQWENGTCTNWEELGEALVPFGKYSRMLQDKVWISTGYVDKWWVTNPNSGSLFWDSASSYGEHYRLNTQGYSSAYTFALSLVGNLNGKNNLLNNISTASYNELANAKNEKAAGIYCEELPSLCYGPQTIPTLETILPEVPTELPMNPNIGKTCVNPDSYSNEKYIPCEQIRGYAEVCGEESIYGGIVQCDLSTISGGSGSTSNSCAGVPANLLAQVYSCDCSSVGVYGVLCFADYGEGYFPEACVRARNLCQ